ncbi:mechanosensitive ion channel [Ramlibacter sp. AW1]|uniref:Mechanosensitive ion channel n=1 Tax=Ramlibacter aurantiacus TaxID=2801330 RepID=A0A937D7C1_9BURK|nr:mechanosensitive ion channel domain-containing protein [Ramlibacter aurantiacus]MBL0423172.1 mechanosensitive ion channel [Ramlibacter aurantiacus]
MLWQVLALLASLAIAGGVAWAVGRSRGGQSVWFGRFIVDGLLFPLLALALTYSSLLALQPHQGVALLRIAVPVLMSLAGIRFLARVLTLVFPASHFARLVERLFSWVAWLAAVLWIAGLLPTVLAEMESIRFGIGRSRFTLLGLLQGVLSAGAVLVVALWVSAALEQRVMQRATGDLSLRRVAANVLRSGLLVIGLLVALSMLGVDLTALSVLGGAIGVGLGFGLQKLASNYVSGFVILFERSLRIGDMVRVDNFEGQVMDIKTRYTLIRAPNGRESIVPNEKLITERIENLSLADTLILLSTDVTVAYASDLDQVQRVLCAAAAGCSRILAEPAPAARLLRFGPDGLEFQLTYWINDPANGQANVRSDVNLAALRGLREAGIEIPYPQRVVHMAQAPAARG